MNREEQFLDVRWQRFRLERLELAGWKCDRCGSSIKKLNVHHLFYIAGRCVWDYLPESTVVLCDACHHDEHKMLSRPDQFGFHQWEYDAAKSIQRMITQIEEGRNVCTTSSFIPS
jgi:hypothetical protein